MTPPVLWQVTPPPERCIGGLTPAIEGMDRMAQAHGWAVERIQKKIQPAPNNTSQLVHFHGLWELSHWRASRWCRRHGVPYLVSPHGMLEPWALRHRGWKKSIYLRLLERSHLLGARAVVTTSELESGNVSKLLPDARVTIAPLGIDPPPLSDRQALREKLGIPAEQPLLVFLSRIDPKKGLPHLLRALAALPLARKENWRLAVVGPLETDHARECQALAAELRDRLPQIQWVGGVWGHDRFDWLRVADLFVLPTHSENFGLVFLEALMVGTPIVTTPYTPWAAHKDIDGIHLVEPNPESVAALLGKGLPPFTTAQREQLIDWAHDHYSWDSLVPAYAEIYGRGAAALGLPTPKSAADGG